MAAPLPSEFALIVPVDPLNPTCDELRAILDGETGLTALLSRWWSAWFKSDGTFTEEFETQICNLPCGSDDTTSTS